MELLTYIGGLLTNHPIIGFTLAITVTSLKMISNGFFNRLGAILCDKVVK